MSLGPSTNLSPLTVSYSRVISRSRCRRRGPGTNSDFFTYVNGGPQDFCQGPLSPTLPTCNGNRAARGAGAIGTLAPDRNWASITQTRDKSKDYFVRRIYYALRPSRVVLSA